MDPKVTVLNVSQGLWQNFGKTAENTKKNQSEIKNSVDGNKLKKKKINEEEIWPKENRLEHWEKKKYEKHQESLREHVGHDEKSNL